MLIIDEADFPSIRAAVDVNLDIVSLPDEVIGLPIFAPAADLWVQGQDANWATRTGPEEEHLVNAAIYKAAALILISRPDVIRREVADMRTHWQPMALEKRIAQLEALAGSEIGFAIGDENARHPVVFTAVGSNRRGY